MSIRHWNKREKEIILKAKQEVFDDLEHYGNEKEIDIWFYQKIKKKHLGEQDE